ncbi:MAG: hypothetical protein IPN76_24460 [Saprospiraceae bacterium]|nr:hypothetical protein [Saprospiraceae bacterium]
MSLTGYHTGRTNGKDEWKVLLSGNVYGTPYQSNELGIFSPTTSTPNDPYLNWFNGEIQVHFGLSENFDIGVRGNSVFMLGLMSKYQLLGSKTSPWAVSIGAELGYLFPTKLYVQVPLSFSYHPNELTSFYLSPRLATEWHYGELSETTHIDYIGGNMGFQTGKNVIFAAELGLYRFSRFNDEKFFPDKLDEKVRPIFGIGLIF